MEKHGEKAHLGEHDVVPLGDQMIRRDLYMQSGEKVRDRRVYLKELKSNNFPSDFLVTILPIVCNHPS
jgi:hypothetical protein